MTYAEQEQKYPVSEQGRMVVVDVQLAVVVRLVVALVEEEKALEQALVEEGVVVLGQTLTRALVLMLVLLTVRQGKLLAEFHFHQSLVRHVQI